MGIVFKNNAKTTLASSLSNSATSATVTDGSVFPSLSAGKFFLITFDDGSNNEICKCTARSGNTLTIVRAQESTTARAFSSGDAAEGRVTAGVLETIQENIAAKSANQTVFNATTAGGATTYNIGTNPGVEANAMVFLNGVLQHHDTISFSGTNLTFDAAPPNGMALEVIIDNLINLQSSNLTVDSFTATDVTGNNTQTDFTLSDTPAAETNLIVFVDGVFQDQDAYTISSNTLTITTGVIAGRGVTVYVINPVNIGTPSDSTVTSAKLSGNITMPGTLTVGSNDVAFDSPTFVVDHTNSRVGLGTASPSVPVDIVGDVKMSANLTVDTSTLVVDSSNNRVGIGTGSPSAPLHVNITGAGDAVKIQGNSITDFDFVANPPEFNLEDTSSTSGAKRTRITVDNDHFRIQALSDDDGTINKNLISGDLSTGDVGIGLLEPSTSFNANRNNLVISDASAVGITLNSTATDGSSIISMTDGTGTLAGEIHYVHDGDYMQFKVNSDEAYRINKTADNAGGYILFPSVNVDPPNPSDQTAGTRIQYYGGSTETFYATGINGNTLWNIADKCHQWFDANSGGSSGTQTARLTRQGFTVPNQSSDGTGSWGSGSNSNIGLESGMVYYNTTNNNFRGYNGNNWIDITTGSLTSITGLQLWADVTGGISSTTVTDLSGNNRSGTLTSTTTKGTLNGNTYFDTGSGTNGQYCEYAANSLPDMSFSGSNACSYFFVVTNQRTRNSYASYMTQNIGSAYQIIRHHGANAKYNFYATNLTNKYPDISNTTTPVNASINEAYIIIFQFKTVGSNTVIDVYKHENGTTTVDNLSVSSVSTGSYDWNSNGDTTRIGNSEWANEYFDGGFFAWGFTNTFMTAEDRTVIYNYYAGKGLAN